MSRDGRTTTAAGPEAGAGICVRPVATPVSNRSSRARNARTSIHNRPHTTIKPISINAVIVILPNATRIVYK